MTSIFKSLIYFNCFFSFFLKLFRSKSYSKYNPISVFLLEYNGGGKIDYTKHSPKGCADLLLKTEIKIAQMINEPYYTINQPPISSYM